MGGFKGGMRAVWLGMVRYGGIWLVIPGYGDIRSILCYVVYI